MGTLTASSTTPNCSKPARRDSSVVCQDRPLLCVSLEFSESRDWICRPDEKFGHFCCVENGDYWGESMLKVDGESWKWVVRGRKKEEGREKKKRNEMIRKTRMSQLDRNVWRSDSGDFLPIIVFYCIAINLDLYLTCIGHIYWMLFTFI